MRTSISPAQLSPLQSASPPSSGGKMGPLQAAAASLPPSHPPPLLPLLATTPRGPQGFLALRLAAPAQPAHRAPIRPTPARPHPPPRPARGAPRGASRLRLANFRPRPAPPTREKPASEAVESPPAARDWPKRWSRWLPGPPPHGLSGFPGRVRMRTAAWAG
ncbi:hypothetical protein LEMLEM_LOCUS18196 [Lemmus lemmus]